MAWPERDIDFTFRLVPLVLRWLETKGVSETDRAQLLQYLPAGAATLPEITAPLSTIQFFLDSAAAKAPCASMGVELAAMIPRGTYAWLEFIARVSISLEAGMVSVCRYYRLLNKGADLVPVRRPEATGVEARVAWRSDGWGRHLNEYTVALFHRICRELDTDWRTTRVWFAHPEPEPAAVRALASWFGLEPQFSQPASGFEGPRSIASRPLQSADPELQRLLESQADDELARQHPLAGLASRVRDEISRRLANGTSDVEAVAQALGLTGRTLQRRLREEGSTFRDVLETARGQHAQRYLRQRALSLSQIATLLGYSDLRAFDRAFRRWAGVSPTEWRESSAA
jgi:AraC-like DNA-binding protein